MSTTLYRPTDVLAANEAWGATCGPGALAAILREPLMGLQPLFPKPWSTPMAMEAALHARRRQLRVHRTPYWRLPGQIRGLAFVQLCGRWDAAPVRVQYMHTHWIAFERVDRSLYVYDVNAGTDSERGAWQEARHWETRTLRELCANHQGASGEWYIRVALEVLG